MTPYLARLRALKFRTAEERVAAAVELGNAAALHLDFRNRESLTEIGNFIDSFLLARLQDKRKDGGVLSIAILGCLEGVLRQIAYVQGEVGGIWGGLWLITRRTFQICEKLSKTKEMKEAALRVMASSTL